MKLKKINEVTFNKFFKNTKFIYLDQLKGIYSDFCCFNSGLVIYVEMHEKKT